MGKYFIKSDDISTLEHVDYDRVVLDTTEDSIVWDYAKFPFKRISLQLASTKVSKNVSVISATAIEETGYTCNKEDIVTDSRTFEVVSEDFGINDTDENVEKEIVFIINGEEYKKTIVQSGKTGYVSTSKTRLVLEDGTSKEYEGIFNLLNEIMPHSMMLSVISSGGGIPEELEEFIMSMARAKEIYLGNDFVQEDFEFLLYVITEANVGVDVLAIPALDVPIIVNTTETFNINRVSTYGIDITPPEYIPIKELYYEGTYKDLFLICFNTNILAEYMFEVPPETIICCDNEYTCHNLVEVTYSNGNVEYISTYVLEYWLEGYSAGGPSSDILSIRCNEGVAYIGLYNIPVEVLYVPHTAAIVNGIASISTIYYNGTVAEAQEVFGNISNIVICNDGEYGEPDT